MSTIQFKITNITCEACVKLSRIALGKISGVKDATVDRQTGVSEVVTDRDVSWAEIENALTSVGKTAVLSV